MAAPTPVPPKHPPKTGLQLLRAPGCCWGRGVSLTALHQAKITTNFRCMQAFFCFSQGNITFPVSGAQPRRFPAGLGLARPAGALLLHQHPQGDTADGSGTRSSACPRFAGLLPRQPPGPLLLPVCPSEREFSSFAKGKKISSQIKSTAPCKHEHLAHLLSFPLPKMGKPLAASSAGTAFVSRSFSGSSCPAVAPGPPCWSTAPLRSPTHPRDLPITQLCAKPQHQHTWPLPYSGKPAGAANSLKNPCFPNN